MKRFIRHSYDVVKNLSQFRKNLLISVGSLLFISYCNYRVYQETKKEELEEFKEKEEMKLLVLEELNKIDFEKMLERDSLDGSEKGIIWKNNENAKKMGGSKEYN